jgi:hypothetical protein
LFAQSSHFYECLPGSQTDIFERIEHGKGRTCSARTKAPHLPARRSAVKDELRHRKIGLTARQRGVAAQRARGDVAAGFAAFSQSDVHRWEILCPGLSSLRGCRLATRLSRLYFGKVLNGARDRLYQRFSRDRGRERGKK